MRIYGFASDSLTNIWAGVGAGLWAVGESKNVVFNKGRRTKAEKMPVGAFGILYCSETGTYTTPFVVYSKPDFEARITDIWADPWVLPFKIKPLGDPTRTLSPTEMKEAIPTVVSRGIKNPLTHFIRVQGNFAFQYSEISDADWSALIERLAI